MNQIACERERDKCNLAAEVLRSFGQVRLKVVGTSMLPTLWTGDLLTIHREDFERVQAGDLVLYARNHRFFVHRVQVASGHNKSQALITRGDALEHADPPIFPAEFLGKVVAIERNGRPVGVHGPFPRWRKLLGLALSSSGLLRRVASRVQAPRPSGQVMDSKIMDFDSLESA